MVLEEQGSNLEDLVWERGSHGFSSGKVVQLGRLLLRNAELVEERRVVLYGLGPEAVYTTSFTREGEGLQPDLGHLGGIKCEYCPSVRIGGKRRTSRSNITL